MTLAAHNVALTDQILAVLTDEYLVPVVGAAYRDAARLLLRAGVQT